MDPETMKVDELRKELKTRGLDSTGVKAALKDRLVAAIEQEKTAAGQPTPVEAPPLDKQQNVAAEAEATTSNDQAHTKERVETKVVDAPEPAAQAEAPEAPTAPAPEEEERRIAEEESKRQARAARFQIPYEPLAKTEQLKKEKRADRFGVAKGKIPSDDKEGKRQKTV